VILPERTSSSNFLKQYIWSDSAITPVNNVPEVKDKKKRLTLETAGIFVFVLFHNQSPKPIPVKPER
jgi:hypothetical protein